MLLFTRVLLTLVDETATAFETATVDEENIPTFGVVWVDGNALFSELEVNDGLEREIEVDVALMLDAETRITTLKKEWSSGLNVVRDVLLFMRVLLTFVDAVSTLLGTSTIADETVSKSGGKYGDCITLLSALELNDGLEDDIAGEEVDIALMLDAEACITTSTML